MKRNFALLSLLLISSFFLTACGIKNNNSSENNIASAPDFNQPEEKADINGIVESITGNEVKILKIDRPSRADSQSANSGEEKATENSGQALNSIGGSGGDRALPPGGQGGAQGSDGNFGTEESRAAILENLKKMSSGEVTVTIPVGIQMLKSDSASATDKDKKMNMVEASLSDIQTDKMVAIWLDKSVADKNVASFVVVNGGFGN